MVHAAALDFQDRRQTNRLRVRPEYRFTLELGRIDDLFPDEPSSDRGRMARLQVLGLFYSPLGFSKAVDAFPACWKWVKKHLFATSSDAEADSMIEAALAHRIVGPESAPFSEIKAGKIQGGLPSSSSVAKIRIPGGYTYNVFPQFGVDFEGVEEDDYRFFRFASLSRVEAVYRKDNPLLGKIPLIARVQRKGQNPDEWLPVPDVRVTIELIPAPPLPVETSEARGSEYLRKLEEFENDSTDVLSGNAHVKFGGHRRAPDVLSRLFETKDCPGFHRPHDHRRLPKKSGYCLPAEALQEPGRIGVTAITNLQGEAGALFLPAPCGGDRYRFRAVAENPIDSVAETGTMVVWRNLRISRILQMAPGRVASAILRTAKTKPYEAKERDFLAGTLFDPESPSYSPIAISDIADSEGEIIEGLASHFGRSYCELELDQPKPERLTQEEWEFARSQAMWAAEQYQSQDLETSFDLRRLFFMDDPSVGVGNAFTLLPMRTPEDYNTKVAPPFGRFRLVPGPPSRLHDDDRAAIASLVGTRMQTELMRTFTHGGALPGLVIVSAPQLATWRILRYDRYDREGILAGEQGLALPYRGCYLYGGGSDSFYTKLTCHEMAHCLFLEHAPPAPGATPEEHQDPGEFPCLMGYNLNPGQFCIQCRLALRGWASSDGDTP